MSVIGNTALSFDDEQAMLLDYARSFCADKGIPTARMHLETEHEHDESLWQEIVAMGWTGIGLPESVGGAGLGIGAAVPVLESMGRVLMGTPLMSSLLAAQLLLRAGGEASAKILESIAAGAMASVAQLESESWYAGPGDTQLDANGRLQGRKRMVMDAMQARWIVVCLSHEGGPALAVVDSTTLAGDARAPRQLMDLTHRAADLELRDVEPALLLSGEQVASALRDYELLGALLVAAESTGAAASALDTILEYLKTRKQFDKLIGSYQALKHPAVDMLNDVDSSRSFVYHAATLVDDGSLDRDQEIACRMAKAQATETLRFAGDRAVQFHGGMGFTWECDAQMFIRRAQWAQQQFGDAQYHRQQLASLLLG